MDNLGLWLKTNTGSLVIGVIALISSYAIYGYKIDDLQRQVDANTAAIASLNAEQVQTQVSLAQIQVDLTYIKQAVDTLTGAKN